MWKIILFVSLLFSSFSFFLEEKAAPAASVPEQVAAIDTCDLLYECMRLVGKVDYAAFRQAVTGFYKIKERRRDILTLIDFSKPSTEERLYVFDLKQRKLLLTSLVSHGRNSGDTYATSFSNENGSYKSSLGFYLTDTTYQGSNGYSLRLDGLEQGINDRARQRAIVVHGAAYSNPSVIRSGGRLGRSLGCPAVPQAVSRPLIDMIKEGSVLYIHATTPEYLAKSPILANDNLSRRNS